MRIGTGGAGRYVAAVALAGGILGAVLLVLALDSSSSPPKPPAIADPAGSAPTTVDSPGIPTGKHASHRHAGGVPDRIGGPVMRAATPLRVTIPRLGVDSPLETLGVDDQGAMETPQDPAEAGWYRLGPTPGSLGPAVIAGHVTWNQVPAVFFRLAELGRGDVVEVLRADHRVAEFKVTKVRSYPKSGFPTRAVFGPLNHAGLRLITCGGDFDSSLHRYSDNVVAFARLTHIR